jgi:hypothetical protein
MNTIEDYKRILMETQDECLRLTFENRELKQERDEAREAMREAWLAMDEIDGTDRMTEWQNKYAHILEETK